MWAIHQMDRGSVIVHFNWTFKMYFPNSSHLITHYDNIITDVRANKENSWRTVCNVSNWSLFPLPSTFSLSLYFLYQRVPVLQIAPTVGTSVHMVHKFIGYLTTPLMECRCCAARDLLEALCYAVSQITLFYSVLHKNQTLVFSQLKPIGPAAHQEVPLHADEPQVAIALCNSSFFNDAKPSF